MTPLKSTSSSFYDGSKLPRKEPQAIRGRTLIVTPPGSVFSAPRGKGPVGDRCSVGEHGHNMSHSPLPCWSPVSCFSWAPSSLGYDVREAWDLHVYRKTSYVQSQRSTSSKALVCTEQIKAKPCSNYACLIL